MKHLLKYFLVVILALVFFDGARGEASSSVYDSLRDIPVENLVEQDSFQASPRADVCPPRQVSTLTVPRVQTSSRHDNSNRLNSVYVKFSRTISTGVNYIAQNKTLIQYSSFVDPDHKLVSLCRFII